ncbi:MAG TPA: hypothetical protein VF114_04155, partial [Candidatus Limnocylindria bacterium]
MERRRAGFRLSWTANDQQEDGALPDEAAPDTTAGAVDTMTAEAPGPEDATPGSTGTPDDTPAEMAADAAPTSDANPATPDGDSSEFLVSLVGAMRGVAESSRDASLAELRTTVDAQIEQLNATAAATEADLRRAADLDLQGVGDWERDETERIKAEAESRRDARRTKLDQQLTEHRAASEREVEATRARLSDHERDLAAFFAQLAEISDPAAFVAAAKRMPQAPGAATSTTTADAAPDTAAPADDPRLAAMSMNETAPDATATADSEPAEAATEQAETAPAAEAPETDTDNRLAARLAQLDQRIAGGTQPVTAAPAPANGGETSTAVIVKGLGSFGAITSFKQALERVEGVRGVTLSLGPTGEFVYRASHAADFDMVAAVQSVEGPSATVEDTDG